MKYYHYCNKPLIINKNFKSYDMYKPNNKPDGIWISIGEEWRKWCIMNDYCINQLYIRNEIQILNKNKIFEIYTKEDIDKFINKYTSKDERLEILNIIEWERFSKKYDGIFIYNYYKLKNYYSNNWIRYLWLYGWDVPSGCIWNPGIIKVVKSKNIKDEINREVKNYENY